MFGVVQRSVPIVVLCVYVCLVVDQELHKIDMAVLTGPVQRCPATIVLCIDVCSPVEELRHYIYPAKMSSPVRRRLTVIEYRCTNSHLLAQPFRNVQMSVQDRHVEGREAGVVLLVNLGAVLETTIHFIHVVILARLMESPLVTLVPFVTTDLLVFEKSDNTCSPFRACIAKESGHAYSSSSNRFHEERDDGGSVMLLRLVVRKVVVCSVQTADRAAFDAPILLPLVLRSSSGMVNDRTMTEPNIILPPSGILVSSRICLPNKSV